MTYLERHWAAMYISETWYSILHCKECTSERDIAYFRVKAAILYDRAMAMP